MRQDKDLLYKSTFKNINNEDNSNRIILFIFKFLRLIYYADHLNSKRVVERFFFLFFFSKYEDRIYLF